jgi:uncharacterized membrane protein YedE/YeeE
MADVLAMEVPAVIIVMALIIMLVAALIGSAVIIMELKTDEPKHYKWTKVASILLGGILIGIGGVLLGFGMALR